MKIVLVTRVYPTQRPGGMPFVCQDRAEELARQGHDVHVITTAHQQRGVTQDRVNGVSVAHTASKPLEWTTGFAQACREYVAKLDPEILHLDSFHAQQPWYLEFKGKARLACTLHGFGFGAFLTSWNQHRAAGGPVPELRAAKLTCEAEALGKFDCVIGVSRHEHWMLQDCYGLPQARLVYNPIARYFFEDPLSPVPEDGPFLCAAVSGHGKRGFDLAKRASTRAGVKLKVCQNVPRRQMVAEYDACRGLVLPTYYAQGYDLAVAEALSRKRPLVLSATGSYLREAERAPVFGACRLFPVGDVDALAESLSSPLPEVLIRGRQHHHPQSHVENWLAAINP